MADKEDEPIAPDELRRRAEDSLRVKAGPVPPASTAADPLRLLHELQVHQVELEMQNVELRRARDELETVLEQYADLYDFAPVGYLTLDRHGIIRRANLNSAELLGEARSRLNGGRFDHFLAAETRPAFADFLEKIFRTPGKVAFDGVLQNHGFPPRSVQIEAMADLGREECRIALIDVSARKRAEEALRREKEATEALRRDKEAAEATARAKSQFLANMSHELRTPMTGILGMIQLALEEDLPPVPRGYLETTLNSARSLLQILNDILDMAKSEAGKLTLEEKPFALPACVAEAVEILMPEVRRKGLNLVVPLASEMPLMVVGDHLRLRQILINLTGNAIKFTKKGKVVVRVAAGNTTADGKREVTFSVSDTGIGIPEDKRGLLFQAFSQIDASHSRTFGGTGLGLAICRELVSRMGGTLSCESQEGVGSTFTFTIPLGVGQEESDARFTTKILSAETTAPVAETGERRPHLLLAEDDPTNRDLLRILLRRANFDLDLAEDGQQAVDMWEKGSYDLVLMDVQMPRLDGFEATQRIRDKERASGGHTPIVAMTAHAFEEDQQRCLEVGMDAYISKPINLKRSLQVIGKILAQKTSSLH